MSDDNDRIRDSARRAFLQHLPAGGAALALGAGCAGTASARPVAPNGRSGLRVDVTELGAVGNGLADDAAAITSALRAGRGNTVTISAGKFAFGSTLTVPPHTMLELLPGAILECRVKHGGHGITLDNGSRLRGADAGAGATQIVADAVCEIESLITNAQHDGSQEFAHIEGISVSARSGARISSALIELVSVFANSRVLDCVIVGNRTAPMGLSIRGGTRVGFGPISVENVWVTTCKGHNIVITEDDPSHGSATCWLRNITSENQGSGHHGLYLKGHGGLFNVSVVNFHYEHGVAVDAETAAIVVDGVPGFSLDGADLLCAPLANKKGIVIARSELNLRTRIRGVQNVNGVSPVLEDDQYGVRFGHRSVGVYESGDTAGVEQMFRHLVQMPGGVTTLIKAGAVTDADFATGQATPDGTLAVDSADNRLYVRVAGTWRSVALS
jgi:hypothetical protein